MSIDYVAQSGNSECFTSRHADHLARRTREVVVIFRGAVTTLPEKFDTRFEGIAAGEELCRNAGWIDHSKPPSEDAAISER